MKPVVVWRMLFAILMFTQVYSTIFWRQVYYFWRCIHRRPDGGLSGTCPSGCVRTLLALACWGLTIKSYPVTHTDAHVLQGAHAWTHVHIYNTLVATLVHTLACTWASLFFSITHTHTTCTDTNIYAHHTPHTTHHTPHTTHHTPHTTHHTPHTTHHTPHTQTTHTDHTPHTTHHTPHTTHHTDHAPIACVRAYMRTCVYMCVHGACVMYRRKWRLMSRKFNQ